MLPSFAPTAKRPNDGNRSIETLLIHCWIEEEQIDFLAFGEPSLRQRNYYHTSLLEINLDRVNDK
jgi:hypothetical protein